MIEAGLANVTVGSKVAFVGPLSKQTMIGLPTDVRSFIANFDSFDKVVPFAFDLDKLDTVDELA